MKFPLPLIPKQKMSNEDSFFIVPEKTHADLVAQAYRHRGFDESECKSAAKFAAYATTHGIRTHNALKALHLDDLFGSKKGGCKPSAQILKKQGRFAASEVWDCQYKLGQATAYEAMDRCIELADKYGIGQVSVDHAFHYLWGGGYVMDAAQKGYIAYTNCTASVTEVVPFMGNEPTLGTNPHSWGFPTVDAIGFPVVIDWATSVIAMGRVQQLKREGKPLPPGAAVDKDGNETTDPSEVAALKPFGAHKGYGLALINEIMAGYIGASKPTIRSHHLDDGDKHTPNFYFQVIHPEALSSGDFAFGRSQPENLKVVLDDILAGGNQACIVPGQFEAEFAERTRKAGGLLFSGNEIHAFNQIAMECGASPWSVSDFPQESA